MNDFVPGQRWFSSAEPELGLGTVMRLAGRSVQIVFTGTGTIRQYAVASAPLARAEFRRGDRIRVERNDIVIDEVQLADGLLVYCCGARRVPEGELDPEQPVSKADTRLLAGRVDRSDQFELRQAVMQQRANALAHPGWGALGARIDLIAHQLRVAEIAASRRPPRLLLADEVGLGKTIEACLILAQQLAMGRAGRALVLLPDSLVHQWFVELLRRFNLSFALFDEERCEAIEASRPGCNAFEDEQQVIAPLNWLATNSKRRTQLLAAGWDIVVVDEAHHLGWSPELASPQYQLVEALAAQTAGVILLTATPEQLGRAGHFARLRLLDPARYGDFDGFIAESERFVAVSDAVDDLLSGRIPDAQGVARLASLFGEEGELVSLRLAAIEAATDAEANALRTALIDDLIDRHGTGRVMVRNRRAAVGGFPRRVAHLEVLNPVEVAPELEGRLRAEFHADIGTPEHVEPEHDYTRDPRMDWLLGVLDSIEPAKALLLCRSRAKVQALEEALRLRSGMTVARFHEDMNLLQRDRNAAFFADPDGTRLLIASEIGAEGRNFQFAQHLIFWDLPLDPDMLEQRIGRLDRIGQRGDVHLHACAIENSPQHALQRWYAEGLDAFAGVCADGRELLREFGEQLTAVALGEPGDLDALNARTRDRHAELSAQILRGRDRLLELASQRGADVGELRQSLAADDSRASSDDYPLRLLEQFGVHHELLGKEVWLLDPEYLTLDAFEAFKHGACSATFDRATALARDDLLFLRADHPLILTAEDLILSSETGNAAFLLDEALPGRTVLLEAVFVLECVAPRALQVERYLPPEPMRCVVDTRLQLRDGFVPSARARERAAERTVDLQRYRKPMATLVPPLVKRAGEAAGAMAVQRIAAAITAANTLLGHEIDRLCALSAVNPAVRPQEIDALRSELAALCDVLPHARPRLDSLRLIASPDFLRLPG
ncbi:MAG: RNA polymerase-associated protein RapA [Pseudomarimonas sp.]